MGATPTSPSSVQGRDLTGYCAAACDRNHAGTPHVPWDCNAPVGGPVLTAEQRRALPEAKLPWVRHATPLLLSAAELERLRGPITSATYSLAVDEDAQDVPEAKRCSQRLEAVEQRLIRAQLDAERASARLDVPARFGCQDARRRAAADPPYLLGTEHFTTAAAELRGWCQATLDRQQQRGCARSEPAIAATLELDAADRQRLHQRAASRAEAAQRRAGRGGGVGRER